MRCAFASATVLGAVCLTAVPVAAQKPPLARSANVAAPVQVGSTPLAFTSEAPEPEAEVARGRADLGWMRGLQRPDIPVRWDPRTIDYLTFFREHPRGQRSMTTWLTRAQTYGPMMRRKLRALGLPEDLMYVAMVESGFDPRARSGRAAVGLWQFVRPTGAQYGLEKNHWIDERMDPAKATEAAGRYLRDLHEKFGTWELALAAYNMGYGALLRTIRKYNTNDYWRLSRMEAGLPYETTLYVAKVMACAVVGSNHERLGFELDGDEAPAKPEVVRVPAGTPLRQIARITGIDGDTLETLNPELRRNRTPPGDLPYALRLPAGTSDQFHQRWADRRPRQPAHRRYVMRFGEDLEEVAHRFRTSTTKLKRINDIDEDSDLGPGTGLLVPAVEPREPEDDEDEAERPVVAVPDALFVYPNRRRVFYRVGGGDTAEDVASFFRVSVDDLRHWNGVDPGATLHDGMMLQLFVPPEVDLSQAVVLSEDEVRILTLGSDEFFEYHEDQK
ncbi:MAG: transglycosylase SLT domain-containing protein, partial [Myxococcota bacterium]